MKNLTRNKTLILYAPNIRSGGGITLLHQFLKESNVSLKYAFISEGADKTVSLTEDTPTKIVGSSLWARLWAEWELKKVSSSKDTVLCFHGLPPLFPTSGKVKIFLQNRLLFNRMPLQTYPWKTRIRLQLERLWVKMRHHHSYKYLVQTLSMERDVKRTLASCKIKKISYVPYLRSSSRKTKKQYDFFYPSCGLPHKNVLALLDAWVILAQKGMHPSLVITIDASSFPKLAQKIDNLKEKHNLNLSNLGFVPYSHMGHLYAASRALIYPSLSESLGLPLLEAQQYNLPIIASERDFVRDSALPKETFDPLSPPSIAQSVQRFLGFHSPLPTPITAHDFLKEVLR